MRSSKTQSGSVVAYAIAAVVLLILLAGSFYLAKHWAAGPSGQTANTPTQPSSEQTEPNGSKSSSGQPKSQSSSTQSSPRRSTQSSGGASQPTTSTSHSNGSKASGSIAPAGPTNIAQTVIGLSVLTAAAVAYQRSRHYRRA